MAFTDDDVKRLKEDLKKTSNLDDLGNFQKEKFTALLDRLEAAEKVCKAAGEIEREDRNLNALIDALEPWRKAAGK